jgi:hypothetical protein
MLLEEERTKMEILQWVIQQVQQEYLISLRKTSMEVGSWYDCTGISIPIYFKVRGFSADATAEQLSNFLIANSGLSPLPTLVEVNWVGSNSVIHFLLPSAS